MSLPEPKPERRLPPPDCHYLDGTIGWLMLGSPGEARLEFDQISKACRGEVEVQEVEWRLLSEEKRWEESLAVAEAMIQIAPEDPSGYIKRSYALHELKRSLEALNSLLPVIGKFPDIPVVYYNLACYACQLDKLTVAGDWLHQAFALERAQKGPRLLFDKALEDMDLRPLWPDIKAGKFT